MNIKTVDGGRCDQATWRLAAGRVPGEYFQHGFFYYFQATDREVEDEDELAAGQKNTERLGGRR